MLLPTLYTALFFMLVLGLSTALLVLSSSHTCHASHAFYLKYIIFLFLIFMLHSSDPLVTVGTITPLIQKKLPSWPFLNCSYHFSFYLCIHNTHFFPNILFHFSIIHYNHSYIVETLLSPIHLHSFLIPFFHLYPLSYASLPYTFFTHLWILAITSSATELVHFTV